MENGGRAPELDARSWYSWLRDTFLVSDKSLYELERTTIVVQSQSSCKIWLDRRLISRGGLVCNGVG
jgi:hypothetical protein